MKSVYLNLHQKRGILLYKVQLLVSAIVLICVITTVQFGLLFKRWTKLTLGPFRLGLDKSLSPIVSPCNMRETATPLLKTHHQLVRL